MLALAGLLGGGFASSVRRATLDRRLGIRLASADDRSSAPTARRLIAAGVLATSVLAAGAVAGPAAGVLAAPAVVAVRWIVLRRRARRADRMRVDQLADAAGAVSAGLRAGLSLPQAIAYARDESPPPLRDDVARLVSAIELGTPVDVALSTWADGVGAEDARLIAAVVELHRRTGGDLPSVLDGVVSTLRQRRAALREVRALTAQARLSGTILGALPIGFFAFLLLTARHDMLASMATPIGRASIGIGVGLELLAFVWIRRLLAVR